MPAEWMGWPLNLRMMVVRGWLVGDGCLSGSSFCGVTISATLRDQIVWTLREAGYRPSVCVFRQPRSEIREKSVSHCLAWQININQSDSRNILESANLHEIERKRWRDKPLTDRTSPTNARVFETSGGMAVRASKTDQQQYNGLVYNMEVDEDHSYVVEDLAVHNCWLTEIAIGRGSFSFAFDEQPGDELAANRMAAIDAGQDPVEVLAQKPENGEAPESPQPQPDQQFDDPFGIGASGIPSGIPSPADMMGGGFGGAF
jgi:hypothetical protein